MSCTLALLMAPLELGTPESSARRIDVYVNTDGDINDDDHLESVDYFIDCHYPGEGESLWAIGGTNGGALGYFPVNYREGTIGSPEAILVGGHTGVVRSVLPMSSMNGGPAQSRGIFGWTGGEDGRLCCWSSNNSIEVKPCLDFRSTGYEILEVPQEK
ncbi:hypothetical protein GH714_023590 [Hevea brasiliensis]|uniref:DOMON domain-containing protein n=1 Tax=Hevea brasiliensis TaxID=3981 RepID=A0A6A6LAG3_HEVBR|nr:hypothetical protein GH714_023590 [Hevea brasiliensis]